MSHDIGYEFPMVSVISEHTSAIFGSLFCGFIHEFLDFA
jgi:hypothetical protein